MVWARPKASVVAALLFGILLGTASSCSTASDEQPPAQYEEEIAALGQTPDVVVPPPNRVIIAVPGLGPAPETVEFASPFELREVAQDDTSLFFLACAPRLAPC